MPPGTIQVRSYTQLRDGKPVTVSEYERSLAATVRPVPEVTVRSDRAGDGKYGSPRKNAQGAAHLHKGVDILATAGADIVSPFDGTVDIKDAYADPDKKTYKIVSVTSGDMRYRYFYVSPNDRSGNPIVTEGESVRSGQKIGIVQDIAKSDRNKNMHNHVHFEIVIGTANIDPTPQIEEWQRNQVSLG